MTTLYKFKAYYTDAGVGAVQDPAPTCTVINMADDSKLADAQATTASTNMPGLYSYEYSGADGLDCVAWFKTTDTGCDVKELASYVSEKITTNLNADVAGVETKLDTVDANVDAILADTGTDGVLLSAGTGAKQISLSSGAVLLQATQTGVTIPTVTTLTNLPSIPNNWITAAGIATGAIDADAIADNAIDAGAIATGAITNAKFAAGAIDAAAIATDAIDADSVKADAVTKLQANLALEATLTAIKGAGWTTETLAAIDVLIDAIKARTDVIPASPAAAGEYTTAIAAIPTAPLLAANYTAPDNATIGTIAGNVDDLETRLTAARAGYLDKLNVSGTLAHSNDAATYKADVSGLATSTEVGAIALLGETVVGSYTVQDILTILAAKMVGKATGGGTATITYRGVDDSSNVVVETVDTNGNRSAVTLTV